MLKVLVVDDDSDLRKTVVDALQTNQYSVDQAADGEEAVIKVKAGNYNLVLLDVNMPKLSGIEAMKEIRAHDPSIIVLILTAYSNIRDAVEATRQGAYNYLEKPIRAENLVHLIDMALKANLLVRSISYSSPKFTLPNGTNFVGQSTEMKKIFSVIEKLARVDTAVLIRGESGTGKELVAQSLHFQGPRKEGRFVGLNCSAIPENLLESELFGHEKGAFTGADSRKIGKFQYAEGGTLFLDEIGDISYAMQVKLLRVLQEKRFTPVGSNREIESNVRIVAATNRPLEAMIKENRFREDLFYRLNVLPVNLPALRERKNDIPLLVEYFVDRFNERFDKAIKKVTDETLHILKNYGWPGNIRELENVIEHSFVLETGNELTPDSLPESVRRSVLAKDLDRPRVTVSTGREEDLENFEFDGAEILDGSRKIPIGIRVQLEKFDFQASKEEFEKQFLIGALKSFKGRINQTALHANIPKKTLLRKLEKYGINARDFIDRL